jgi:spermidine synthase
MSEQKYFQLQYTELWEGKTGITFGLNDILFSRQSAYQKVQVLETDAHGRVLTLDGLVMLTERDEFVYHEMISHPALCLLKDAERVLVVGGGDGGTVREILRHPSIKHVDLVEIDEMVINTSREFFPTVSSAFDDPRLNIRVQDGIAFVKATEAAAYDLVIVDSTDPVGFAEGLFGEDFYRDCARILTDRGILAAQTESPFDRSFHGTLQDAHNLLNRLFPQVHMYLASIPTYPFGTWSFTMATKGLHPVDDFDPEAARRLLAPFKDDLKYYNPEIHTAAFALPNFVRKLIQTA